MEILRWKTRIAVLWILSAVVMSAHMILMVMDPVVLKKIAEWAPTATLSEWVLTALFWLVPLWMAFAAITLKGPSNRWLNFFVAIIFAVLNIWHFFICGVPLLKGSPFEKATPHHMLLVASPAVATALVAWYALKWPKQDAGVA